MPACALAGELLALGPKLVPSLITGLGYGLLDFAAVTRELGRHGELLPTLAAAPDVPWVTAARAIASGDPERAAVTLAAIDFPAGEAYARLLAAERLVAASEAARARQHAEAAVAFYRSVGATHFIARADECMATRSAPGG